MSKAISLLLIALLLSVSLSQAARPLKPVHTKSDHHEIVKNVDEACEGFEEEDCLMRRTLNAHIDYIYTQDHKP